MTKWGKFSVFLGAVSLCLKWRRLAICPGAVGAAKMSLRCETGKRAEDSVLRTQIASKRTHFVAGAPSQRVFVTTGGVGKNPRQILNQSLILATKRTFVKVC